MKSIKYFLPLIVLFLSIGYAATNVTLSITGDVITMSDIEDFDVYISDIKVDGVTDIMLLKDNLIFEYVMKTNSDPRQSVTISYDATNNSENFDAAITINCLEKNVGLNTELTAINTFNSEKTNEATIVSKETTTGTMTFTRMGPISQIDSELVFSCTITAEPIERKELGVGETPDKIEIPVYRNYSDTDKDGYISVSDTVTIDTETFRIINTDNNNITMIAENNLGVNYKQSEEYNYQKFSNSNGWENAPWPAHIDIQKYDGPVKTYLNNYKDYIKEKIKIENISIGLATNNDFKSAGCWVNNPYEEVTCEGIRNSSWLEKHSPYWTTVARRGYEDAIYAYNTYGFNTLWYNENVATIKPIINIPTIEFKEKFNTLFDSDPYIQFVVDGIEYFALKDMTWEEWINSDYNTDKRIENRNGIICAYNSAFDDCISLEAEPASAYPEPEKVILESRIYFS